MANSGVGQSPSAPDKGCNQPPRFWLCASGFILRVVGLVTKPMCFCQLHRLPFTLHILHGLYLVDTFRILGFLFTSSAECSDSPFCSHFHSIFGNPPFPHNPVFGLRHWSQHTYPEASYLALESCFLSSSFRFSFMATTGIGTGITRAWEHGKYILAYYNSTHHWVWMSWEHLGLFQHVLATSWLVGHSLDTLGSFFSPASTTTPLVGPQIPSQLQWMAFYYNLDSLCDVLCSHDFGALAASGDIPFDLVTHFPAKMSKIPRLLSLPRLLCSDKSQAPSPSHRRLRRLDGYRCT